jgi:beta-galactosidase
MPTPIHLRPSQFPNFLFGVAYYPEHWPRDQRLADPARMAAADVNVVRLAEFAWDRMEPRLNEFDFSLFDETINRCGDVGIDTILCTPTAAPPRWLTAAHPDWLRVDADGRTMTHGSRQHCCTTNRGFRAASRRITQAMADHFAANPRVIGWQTDNEFHCHFSECHCPACLSA